MVNVPQTGATVKQGAIVNKDNEHLLTASAAAGISPPNKSSMTAASTSTAAQSNTAAVMDKSPALAEISYPKSPLQDSGCSLTLYGVSMELGEVVRKVCHGDGIENEEAKCQKGGLKNDEATCQKGGLENDKNVSKDINESESLERKKVMNLRRSSRLAMKESKSEKRYSQAKMPPPSLLKRRRSRRASIKSVNSDSSLNGIDADKQIESIKMTPSAIITECLSNLMVQTPVARVVNRTIRVSLRKQREVKQKETVVNELNEPENVDVDEVLEQTSGTLNNSSLMIEDNVMDVVEGENGAISYHDIRNIDLNLQQLDCLLANRWINDVVILH